MSNKFASETCNSKWPVDEQSDSNKYYTPYQTSFAPLGIKKQNRKNTRTYFPKRLYYWHFKHNLQEEDKITVNGF